MSSKCTFERSSAKKAGIEKASRKVWKMPLRKLYQFPFLSESKLAYWRTAFLLKISSLKYIFQRSYCFQRFLTIFLGLGEHLFDGTRLVDCIYSGIFIKQTSLGPGKVPTLWRCPLYRDSIQKRIFSKNKSRIGLWS